MRWSYKTVHYEMKKEGLLGSAFLDESEIEQSLNEYGKAGWELVSMLETLDGLIAVFKQPLSLGLRTVPRGEGEAERQPILPKLVKKEEKRVEPPRFEERARREETDDEIVLIDDFEDERDEPVVEVKKRTAPPEAPDVGSIRIE